MIDKKQPLVSVVTPVYNGEGYLADCIESVLAQTYPNWEYIIVDNCSTDRTPKIIDRYAKANPRIRVHRNEKLLDIISNHNKAFSLISSEAKYCKVVSADDWLFSECITKMVDLAEAKPSVGIVGSYQLSGVGTDWRNWRIKWAGLPYPSSVIPGHQICRLWLMNGPYVFGTPTSILYRADLVRKEQLFYPNSTAEADTSACLKNLRNSDFGFVHQVLSYERVHQAQITATSKNLNAYLSSQIGDLIEYGQWYLTAEELAWRLKKMIADYYKFLAVSAFSLREKKFWDYHIKRLKEIGYPFQPVRLVLAMVANLVDLLLNPKRTLENWVMSHAWALKTVKTIKRKPESAEARLESGDVANDDPEHGQFVQL
ncbi:MAG TPA: glycosyltransferase family 2 protein [Candidatus Acidoferrum sp.]|nr:glycosyltransferase family 2 protein [Candidatus Acidoferrum sp.]